MDRLLEDALLTPADYDSLKRFVLPAFLQAYFVGYVLQRMSLHSSAFESVLFLVHCFLKKPEFKKWIFLFAYESLCVLGSLLGSELPLLSTAMLFVVFTTWSAEYEVEPYRHPHVIAEKCLLFVMLNEVLSLPETFLCWFWIVRVSWEYVRSFPHKDRYDWLLFYLLADFIATTMFYETTEFFQTLNGFCMYASLVGWVEAKKSLIERKLRKMARRMGRRAVNLRI